MTTAWLVSSSLKAALLLAASGVGAVLLRRSAAAARHHMWTLGVVAALVVPLLALVLPSLLSVDAPAIVVGAALSGPAIVVGAGAAASPSVPWLAIVWAAGTLLVGLRIVLGQIAAHRIARTAVRARSEHWLSAQRAAAVALGMPDDIVVSRSEAIDSPMTIGVVRPRVLLPAAADDWSAARLRAVLVHELGHIRRRDLMVQLAAQVACALYWWNPLAWLAASRLRNEREHACDDLVLAAGALASSYATDLLEVSRAMSSSHVAGACMADRSGMELRLHRILDTKAPRRPLGAGYRIAAGGLALASACILACTSASASHPPDEAVTIGVPSSTTAPRQPLFEAPAFQQPRAELQDATYLAAVSAELGRNTGALRQCFERRRAVHPELGGEVVVHWVILADGSVPEQCITRDTVGDREVADCVNQLISGTRFPAPRGGSANVEFPFVFRGR